MVILFLVSDCICECNFVTSAVHNEYFIQLTLDDYDKKIEKHQRGENFSTDFMLDITLVLT